MMMGAAQRLTDWAIEHYDDAIFSKGKKLEYKIQIIPHRHSFIVQQAAENQRDDVEHGFPTILQKKFWRVALCS